MNIVPVKDQKVSGIREKIAGKSSVLYFPIPTSIVYKPPPVAEEKDSGTETDSPLSIVWNHRWEYDKVR